MRENMNDPFTPDWRIAPGDLLADIMSELSLDVSVVARRSRLPTATVRKILKAEIPITPQIAEQLDLAFGISAEYWLNAQKHYDDIGGIK